MKKQLLISVITLMISFAGTATAQINPAFAAGLQSILDTHMSQYGVEGVEATVILPGECSWTGVSGYATSPGDPVDTSRFWHFASTTKSLTAAVILQLHDSGLININDPIGLHWDNKIKNIRSINNNPVVDSLLTIKRLLNHTTNIKNTWYSGSNLWTDVFDPNCTVWTLDSALSNIYWEDSDPLFPVPQHNYLPWNNYVVLGLLVEAVTGNALATEVQNRFFTPLGMTHSYFAVNGVNTSTINGIYNNTNNLSSACRNDYLSTRGGSSYWIGSTKESARFIRAFHNDLLVSAAMMDSARMKTPGTPQFNPGTMPCIGTFKDYYGYGVEITEIYPTGTNDTLVMYGHAGNGLGGSATIHYRDLNITVSIAGNDYNYQSTYNTGLLGGDLMCYAISNLSPSSCLTGIEEHSEILATVSPNPGNNLLQLTLAENIVLDALELIATDGQVVKTLKNCSGTINIDTSHLASGVYVVRMTSASEVISRKWVRE